MTGSHRTEGSVHKEPHEGGPFSHETLLARKQNAHLVNPFRMGMVRTFRVVQCLIYSRRSSTK